MKKYVIILLLLIGNKPIYAQTLEARYAVSYKMNVPTDNKNPEIVNFNYDGFLYKSGSKTIYFQKPLYLKDYPSGYYKTVFNNLIPTMPVFIDTMQMVYYNNTDSLRSIVKVCGMNVCEPVYNTRTFELGAWEWKLLNELKEINGLKCQRAQLIRTNYATKEEEVYHDVWFCPDININFGPGEIRDIPGLVVEAISYKNNHTYTLTSYSINQSIPNSVFWPDEFKTAKFLTMPALKKIANAKNPNNNGRADIMKQ
jgi:GLPGLI family protein